jgi:Tfp pilus assembly protein PilE
MPAAVAASGAPTVDYSAVATAGEAELKRMKTSFILRGKAGGRNLTADLRPLTSGPRSGFSLLEVLMAVTVLIIIVLIISMIFQQTHTAWGTGIRKAGAETTLRSVMGIMERDLTHAVDATQFGRDNTFESLPASFVTLDGVTRMPQAVRYSFASGNGMLTRETASLAAPLAAESITWTEGAWTNKAVINGSQPLSRFQIDVIEPVPPASAGGLPLRVEIEAHVLKRGSFAIVSGWSEGRNRPGHDDRIVVSP